MVADQSRVIEVSRLTKRVDNGGDREAATDFLDSLARDGRYARDVY